MADMHRHAPGGSDWRGPVRYGPDAPVWQPLTASCSIRPQMLLRRSPKSKYIQHTDKGTAHATSARRSCGGLFLRRLMTVKGTVANIGCTQWRLQLGPRICEILKVKSVNQKIADTDWWHIIMFCLTMSWYYLRIEFGITFLCVKSVSNHKRRLWRMGLGGGGCGLSAPMIPTLSFRASVHSCTFCLNQWRCRTSRSLQWYSGMD